MEKQLKKLGVILLLLFVAYNILSYLILLRDDFLLERLAFLTESPWILEAGRRWASLLHVNSIPTLLFFITITAMFFIYLKALRLLKGEKRRTSVWRIIFSFAVLYMIITLTSFPVLSTDVFDYIASNRVLYVHQANPWLVAPEEFPKDEFIYLGSWKFRASVYGPVQFLFSSAIHMIARDNLIANIVGFKITGALFAIALILVMKKWLEESAPDNLLYGITVFAWNPLLHIEIIGNAHNDIVMAFFAFLGFYWFTKRKMLGAASGLALAALAKVAAILFVPVMAVWLITQKKKKQAEIFIVLFLTFLLAGFATLGEGLMGFVENLGVQLSLYLRSLPTIMRFIFLQIGVGEGKAVIAEKLLTIPPFAALLIMLLRKVGRTGLLYGMVASMMLYFLIAAPMLQPWYLVWVLPFVALLIPGKLQTAALVFSWSSLIYYTVLFISFYFSPLHFAWQIVMFLTMVIPPLLIWILPETWYTQLSKSKRQRN